MRLYLSGPMAGYEDSNYPAFVLAADVLREHGYEVENPAEFCEECRLMPDDDAYADFMRCALKKLMRADGVALLYGWEHSRGAKLEVQVAEVLGMKIKNAYAWDPIIEGDSP